MPHFTQVESEHRREGTGLSSNEATVVEQKWNQVWDTTAGASSAELLTGSKQE